MGLMAVLDEHPSVAGLPALNLAHVLGSTYDPMNGCTDTTPTVQRCSGGSGEYQS